MNRSKYGITPDLSMPEGRGLFLELVKDADIVIENNSPRVMRNLNLTYEVLREVNPRLIMLQIAAYGQTGPNTDYIAYGANIEAASGLASVTGYADDERPYRTGYFYADPVTATHASAAILAALHRREQTGEGMYIDLSLQENGISFLPQSMIEYTMSGKLPERRGNRHTVHAPQGVYRTIGEDMWMSLCVRSDDDWRRLVDTIGDDRLRDERFANEESRRTHHDEIDGVISEWALEHDHNEASAIPAGGGCPRRAGADELGDGEQLARVRARLLRDRAAAFDGCVAVSGHHVALLEDADRNPPLRPRLRRAQPARLRRLSRPERGADRRLLRPAGHGGAAARGVSAAAACVPAVGYSGGSRKPSASTIRRQPLSTRACLLTRWKARVSLPRMRTKT